MRERRQRTDAPASLHTLASVRSGARTRVRNLPECEHAALWRPLQSKTPPHSHRASATGNGTRNRSKINTQKRSGLTRNSSWVGQLRVRTPAAKNGTADEWAWCDGHELGQHYGLPEVVLGSGSRVVLSTVGPFTGSMSFARFGRAPD